jgi:hypothetical protein
MRRKVAVGATVPFCVKARRPPRLDRGVPDQKADRMDPASIATAMLGVQSAQTQLVLATKMAKMSAQADSAIVAMIDAAAQNASSLANVAEGIGGKLDISV